MDDNQSETEALTHAIIKQALAHKASEVHLEIDGEISKMSFVIGGRDVEYPAAPKSGLLPVLNYIRTFAKMGRLSGAAASDEGVFNLKYMSESFTIRVSMRTDGPAETLILKLNKPASAF